jgi:hypothetical protein
METGGELPVPAPKPPNYTDKGRAKAAGKKSVAARKKKSRLAKLKEELAEKKVQMELKELDEKMSKIDGGSVEPSASGVVGPSTQRCIEMAEEWLRQRGCL